METTKNLQSKNKDDFQCPICLEIMAEPIVTACKHYLCLSCHKEAKKIKSTCPMCREYFKMDFEAVIDKNLQAYISQEYQSDFEKRKQDLIKYNLWSQDNLL